MRNKDLIIACDFDSETTLLEFLNKFGNEKMYLKLGMEIIYAAGLEIISRLAKMGHTIFLDLKLFDIPNTVKKAVKSLNNYPIKMLTIHGSSDQQTLNIAVKEAKKDLEIIAVSVLTSFTVEEFQKNYMSSNKPIDFALQVAKKISFANGAGIVCSIQEAKVLKQKYPDLILVVPGIRESNDAFNDQARVGTIAEAKVLDIDYIVMGRPITHANDPYQIYLKYRKEFLS